MESIKYTEALPQNIIRLRDAGAPVYVPIGSLEWHDTHAPLGTDGFIAEGLSQRLAQQTGGAVMPPLYWGLSLADAVKPPYIWQAAHGSLSLGQPDVWEAFMRAQIGALLDDGWRIVVLLAGHVGGTETKILSRLAAEHAQPHQPQVIFLNPYHHTTGDHAGYFETNMLLGLRPESVQPAPSEGNPWARAPADAANARDGGQMVRESVAGMLEQIQAAGVRINPLLTPPCAMVQDAAMPKEWTARWIAPAAPARENFHFLARSAFQIKELPASARLHITADTRYTVWLNGQRAGCGPMRGSHRRYFVDTYDVTPILQPGKNWLAIAVHCPVSATFNAVPHAPGLLAEHGVNDCIAHAGRNDLHADIIRHDGTTTGVCRVLAQHFNQPAPPATGFVIARALAAVTCAGWLTRQGLKIPGDVSLICRDADPVLEAYVPAIAHYRVDEDAYARQCAGILIKLAESGAYATRATRITARFTPGSITAPPAC